MSQHKVEIAGVKVSGRGMAGAVGVFAALIISPPVVSAALGSAGCVGTGGVVIAAKTTPNVGVVSCVGQGSVTVDTVTSASGSVGAAGRGHISVSVKPFNKSGIVSGRGILKTNPPTIIGKWAQPVTGSGGVTLRAVYTALGDRTLSVPISSWVLNTATGGHSQYTNYPFTGMFRLGHDYYGINASGVYRLTGTLDGAEKVVWEVLSGVSDFDERHKKYAREAFIYMRSSGDVTLRTIVDEQLDRGDYTIEADDNPGIHRVRVKLSRKVAGTAWQISLSGSDPVTVQQTELDTIASNRT